MWSRVYVGVCARVHACFLFAMGIIELGAFFYKSSLLSQHRPSVTVSLAVTNTAGGQGGK